jgi:hypothetical protein
MVAQVKLHIPTVRMVRALCREYGVRTCIEAYRKAYAEIIGGNSAVVETDFRLFQGGDTNPPAYLRRACLEKNIPVL